MAIELLFAGFGGQGILFAGKVTANTGLIDSKQVTWLPSYGPEMRGGTANCSVCLSDDPIGCPMVVEPNLLVVMNAPSYEKFIDTVKADGRVVFDSSLIHPETLREDTHNHAIPATQLAADNGLDGLANIIILGHTLKLTGFTSYESMKAAIQQCVPRSKEHLLDANHRALKLGYDYQYTN